MVPLVSPEPSASTWSRSRPAPLLRDGADHSERRGTHIAEVDSSQQRRPAATWTRWRRWAPGFTSGTICAHGYCQHLQINVECGSAGLTGPPATFCTATGNGVAGAQRNRVGGGAGVTELVEAEMVILGYLRAGKVMKRGFRAARKESQRRIEALGKKLRGES